MKKTLLVAAAVATLAAGAAIAQTAPPPPTPPTPRAGPGPGGDFGPGGPGGHRGPGGPGGGRFMHGPRPSLQDIQKRNAEAFARMDVNKDGKVTFEEFRQDMERRRTDRQRRMFERFTGGGDSVTLDQMNARAAERYGDQTRRGGRGPGGPGGGPDGGPDGGRGPGPDR